MSVDTFDIVLTLIRKSINPSDTEQITVADWDSLFNELSTQGISAISADLLAQMVPASEKRRLIQAVSVSLMTMHKHLEAQDSLGRLYQEKGIPFVILKGLAVSRYYPKPEYRSLGDIDIAVLHADYEAARQAMLQDGYREVKSHYEKHGVFEKNGLVFELHKYFASANDVKKASFIEEQIQNGIMSPVICELKGYRFPVLPPTADGIMLLEHMSQHLEDGIGLRHMMDWMLYVSHELNDAAWQNGFRDAAAAAGLCRLAEVSTKLCVRYLGLRGISWCDTTDEEACDRLLAHVKDRGNFGHKSAAPSSKAQKLLSIHKGIFYRFRYLQRTGLRIPFVAKHRILHPFAWLIRAFVLVSQYLKGGNTVLDLRQEYEKAKEIESFMDDLGIRRVSRGHTFWNGSSFVMKK